MPLYKHEIPILEHDTEKQAVIMPNRKNEYSFPKKAVFPFLFDTSDRYALENGCEKLGDFESITKLYPIYRTRHMGREICICQAPLGSSAAVQILDFLIGHGVEQVIAVGSCGALEKFDENVFLIPTEALRDEGTSYHYLPPARTVKLDPAAIEAVKTALERRGIEYRFCRSWTTDGFFRETAEMVNYRREEGFSVVEMECAGLAACAEFRGAQFGQILFTADTLANVESHDERDWGKSSHELALMLALDAAAMM